MVVIELKLVTLSASDFRPLQLLNRTPGIFNVLVAGMNTKKNPSVSLYTSLLEKLQLNFKIVKL